jgi:hypothetical protein
MFATALALYGALRPPLAGPHHFSGNSLSSAWRSASCGQSATGITHVLEGRPTHYELLEQHDIHFLSRAPSVVNTLIAANADVNVKNNKGETMLSATAKSDPAVVAALKAAGAGEEALPAAKADKRRADFAVSVRRRSATSFS